MKMIDENAELESALIELYSDLIENQKPLDGEFAKVLYENIWELYDE